MREYAATPPTAIIVAPIVDQYLGTRTASEVCGSESVDDWEHLWIELGGEG